MAIQSFTIGQTLTAAQMTALQANDYNQTVSTKTVSYTLVAADIGTRVVMNSASATTITVNTSLFSAGDTLVLQNIGAGVCTVTAGTATVSTAGSLAIPQNGSGILYFTSAGVSIFYPSAGAQVASGLVLVKTQTIGTAVGFETVTGAFSSTYDNYKIIISGGAASTAGQFGLKFGSTATGYYAGITQVTYSSATGASFSDNNAASFAGIGYGNTNGLVASIEVTSPNLAKNTFVASQHDRSAIPSLHWFFKRHNTIHSVYNYASIRHIYWRNNKSLRIRKQLGK